MFTEIDKKVIHEVALNNFVKDYIVEDIILCIEHGIYDIIESSDPTQDKFKTINITNFGKFIVSKKKREYAKQYYGKRDKDINEGQEGVGTGACIDTTPDCVE
jgi:hypothetical protein